MIKKDPGSFLASPPWIYALVSLAAFAPCWLRGYAYFDNDLLAQFGPWRQFLKDQLAQGNFPLWNPYLMGGQPFFADPQNMMLYPFNWPTLLLPVAAGLTLFFMVHMAWAGWGMHLWLRALGLSEASCRVGGLLFCLSGFFWMEIIHPPVLAAFSWLPWLFLTLERLATSPTAGRGFLAGLSLAMLFLCGSFQVFLGGLYGGAAYFLFRSFTASAGARHASPGLVPSGIHPRATHGSPLQKISFGTHERRGTLLCLLLFLWGALPLLGQLIPTAEFSAHTNRRVEGEDYARVNAKLSLPFSSLHQLVLPRFGLKKDANVPEVLQSLDESKNLWPILGFLGVWAPFLAALALGGRERKVPYFLGGLALVGLTLALGRHFPLHRLFHEVVPGFDLIRVPFRYLFLYVLGMSALAAYGYEAWVSRLSGEALAKRDPRGAGQSSYLKWALGFSFLLYLAALWRPFQNWRELLALGFGLGGIILFGLFKNQGKLGGALFQAALVLPLLLSGWACFQPGPASNFNFEKNSSMLMELGKQITPERMIFLGENYYPIEVGGKKYALSFPQNAACVLGLKNFGGYNPLALRSKSDLASLPLETLVKLSAIRAVVTQRKDLSLPGFKARSVPPYQVHEWQGDLPYVFAPQEIKVLWKQEKSAVRIPVHDLDPYLIASLQDRNEWGPQPPFEKGIAGLKYTLMEDLPDQQSFQVELDRDKLVVFCETYFPGWRALVGGKTEDLIKVDHFLRGVYLKKGEQKVDFRFEPFWWPAVPVGLALWLLATLAGWFLYRSGSKIVGAGPRARPAAKGHVLGDGKHRPYKRRPGKPHA